MYKFESGLTNQNTIMLLYIYDFSFLILVLNIMCVNIIKN